MTELSTSDRSETTAEARTRALERVLALDPVHVASSLVSLAVAIFLLHQLMAWPPHEDESLALLVGRDSLGGVVSHVTRDRGGAPLHFLFAWAIAHVGLGLGGLRLVSLTFAVASIPLIGLLSRRLAGPAAAVGTVALAGGSWLLLFHGIYGRMYSLFLVLSLLSCLALLSALEQGGRRAWFRWLVVTVLCIASHPYGALVVSSELAAALLLRTGRSRVVVGWFTALGVVATPFWLTDLVLAGRFDVGVGGGGAKLGGPRAVVGYLYEAAGDMTAGWPWVLAPVLLCATVGLVVAPRVAQRMAAAFVVVPSLAFLAARLGHAAAPESRHLIFVLPFFLLCVVLGIRWLARGIAPAVALVIATLVVAEIAWAWHRTAPLFEWEPSARRQARVEGSAYVAATSSPDDLLLGYDPLFLGAWERDRDLPATVLPRADSTLMLKLLRRSPKPLGHGVWVLDASDNSNPFPQPTIGLHRPLPEAAFSARTFGPFLVIRTRDPVGTIDGYLFAARQATLLGQSLGIGDADVNRATIEGAQRAYDISRWGDPETSSASTSR